MNTLPRAMPANEPAKPAATVKKVVECAESFTRRHAQDKAVGLTFTYFTRHPVAPLNRKRLRVILELLQSRSRELKRPLRVLDLACGGGLITSAIATLGHRALGIDLSAEEIHLAKLFALESKLDGTFLQADLLNDPEWEKTSENALGGKPDVVSMAYALHHLPQVESFVERLARWMDPGSLLLVNEENPESPLFRLKHRVRGWIQKDTDVEWHRRHSEWSAMLEKSGLKPAGPLVGLDLVPALGRLCPELCWSLVFLAVRS